MKGKEGKYAEILISPCLRGNNSIHSPNVFPFKLASNRGEENSYVSFFL